MFSVLFISWLMTFHTQVCHTSLQTTGIYDSAKKGLGTEEHQTMCVLHCTEPLVKCANDIILYILLGECRNDYIRC